MNNPREKKRMRRWHRWAVWAVYSRNGEKLHESLVRYHTFKRAAASEAHALECSPGVLADLMRSMADGSNIWVDCEVRPA